VTRESEDAREVRKESLNAQLQHAVCQQLGLSGRQSLRKIHVTVDNHRVTLSGTVSSFYLKQIAQEAARHVCPDRKVYNELDVVQAS
jgi:osmotically-inducible protein OsmY